MSKLLSEIEEQTKTAEQAIPAAQEELRNKLRELKASLTDSRWQTFTEATWHATAVIEYAKLESAVESGNLALLKETLSKAQEMLDRSEQAILYYLGNSSGLEYDPRYDQLKDSFKKIISSINDKKLRTLYPAQRDKLFSAVTDAQSKLRGDGPGTMNKNHANWLKQIAEFEKQRDDLLREFREFERQQKDCLLKVKELKSRLGGELVSAIQKATAKTVSANNLPLMSKVLTVEAQLGTAKLTDLEALDRRITNLQQELELTLNDPEGFNELIATDQRVRQEDAERVDALLQLQTDYENELEKYEQVFARLKKMKDVDRDEKRRIKDLGDDARKSAKTKDWGGAKRKMSLARRLAEQLERDPLASQTTQRGLNHLKELNPRWTRGIDALVTSVEKLSGAIDKSCDDEEKPVVPVFNSKIVSRYQKSLSKDAFQQELLILGTDPPKGSDANKDKQYRKKIREQALVKVRRYRDLVTRDPVFTSLMFENNPWSRSGGNVTGVDLMRALNDLDLNLQRAV